MTYTVSILTPERDGEILELLESVPLGERPRLVYTARPSYFRAMKAQHEDALVIGIDHSEDGLVGVGAVSTSTRYLQGTPTPIGYLEHLRIHPAHRGRGLLRKGLSFLKEHRDRIPEVLISSLLTNNEKAKRILTASKHGYPTFKEFGTVTTKLLLTKKKPKPRYSVRNENTAELKKYIDAVGRRKALFPAKSPEGETLYAAREGGLILGACGVWHQQAFKQTCVESWGFPLRLGVELFNARQRLRGGAILPSKGVLPYAAITRIAITDNNPAVLDALLSHIENVYREHHPFLAAGLDTDDPLLQALRTRQGIEYTSTIYTVDWAQTVTRRKEKLIYPEIALL